LQPEDGPAVVKQIELDIAAAANELMLPQLGTPGQPHPRPHDGRKNRVEGLADRAQEREIALPIAAIEIIEEDPADAARLAAMLEKEILVAPGLEARITILVVTGAGARQRGMKLIGGGRVGID